MPNLEKPKEFSKSQMYMAARGDQDAISELYEKTYNQVYRTVKAMVADEDAVLDIVQDSYVKAFQSLDQLDEPENFRAWMKRIATNKAKDYFKKKRPVLFSEMVSEDDEEIDFQDDRTENLPEAVIDRQETTRLIGEMLQTLSEDQRIVIGMFYYEQMSVKEIAQILGCSENTVKSRLNYGRKKVEAQVLDLEKRGTKLYSLAPMAFLMWLFRMDAEAAAPSQALLQNILLQTQGSLKGGKPHGKSASHGAANGAANEAASAGVKAGVKAGAKAGGKALTTKIVAGVLVVSVVGGGAAVAITAAHQDDSETTTPTRASVVETLPSETAVHETEIPIEMPTDAALPAVTAEMAYESVNQDFIKAMSANSDTYGDVPYQFINRDLSALFYYHMAAPDFQFYTAQYDINKDGTNELLIGLSNPGGILIVDVYGFNGETPVHLVDRPALGSEDARLNIMTNGMMHYSGILDYNSSTQELLKIAQDGHSLETVASANFVAGEDNGQFETITAKAGELTPVENFDWKLLEPENQHPQTDVSAYDAICERILVEYRTAAAMDHEEFNSSDAIYERFPNLDGMMYDYHAWPDGFPQAPWYYAISDLDGDGIGELFIGFDNGDGISILDCYAWNGEDMVRLGVEGNCDILADGTVVDHTGNGGEIAGVYRLQGSSLVENPDAEPALRDFMDYRAFTEAVAAHGGAYQPQWKPLFGE